MTRTTIAWITLVVFLAIVGFDVYLAFDGEPANTFSATWRRAGYGVPLLVSFGCGLVVGHIWWGKK